MRSLSATLLEAQKAATRTPYVKVEVVERVGGVTRFNWQRLYSGSEPGYFHAVTMPGDGSLVRIRVDGPAGNLYRQRVTDPDENSNYSSWTYFSTERYAVALCSRNAEVIAFTIVPYGNLYRCESNDYGASWGDWIDMGPIAGTASDFRLAACFKDNGDCIVLYSDGATLYRRRRISGVWEAAAAWSNTLSSITGIAVTYMGDWNVVITGIDGDGNRGVWTCILGDGYSGAPDTWSSLAELMIAAPTSEVEFHYPSLSFPDVFRMFFVERYTGTEAYSRPYWSHSLATADFISNLWREPVPVNLSSDYGLALCYKSPHAWLTRPDGVWRAPLTPASVELTDDVIAVETTARPFAGASQVTLRNDDGRYNSLGSGTYEAIKQGSEVLLQFGYHTTQGPETGGLEPTTWISRWEYVTRGGQSEFIIYARDGWDLLERWRARRQFTWEAGAKNIFQLLAWIFARAGLEFSAFSSSSAVVNQYPSFTIHPRESGLTAVKRLLDMVPDVIFFVRDAAYLKNPLPGDASQYSYGTDHAIHEGLYLLSVPGANRVQVFGNELMTEDWDWDEVHFIYDRLTQEIDINLDTVAKAHQRGEAILREAEMEAVSGHILVPINCGQDLYDVIDITSPQAGLNASKRRGLALIHTLDTFKGQVYPQSWTRSAIIHATLYVIASEAKQSPPP